jgi:hypothetical protein
MKKDEIGEACGPVVHERDVECIELKLGTLWRRWGHNIKMNLRKIECVAAVWINLAQDKDRWGVIVNTAMNLHVL